MLSLNTTWWPAYYPYLTATEHAGSMIDRDMMISDVVDEMFLYKQRPTQLAGSMLCSSAVLKAQKEVEITFKLNLFFKLHINKIRYGYYIQNLTIKLNKKLA